MLTEGETVQVKILDIKPEAKRISLSVKEAQETVAPEKKDLPEENENQGVTLGDVFGDLFNKSSEEANNREEAEETEEDRGETPSLQDE